MPRHRHLDGTLGPTLLEQQVIPVAGGEIQTVAEPGLEFRVGERSPSITALSLAARADD
jgi:hypothetical protein